MRDEVFEYDGEQMAIARCEECGELIFDDSDAVYTDCEGNYFCSLDCALNFYGIAKAEDCLVAGR